MAMPNDTKPQSHTRRDESECRSIRYEFHPNKMSVEAMMMNAFAVSLRPAKTRLMVRNSIARPSVFCAMIAKPRRPVVLSESTFSSACIQTLCAFNTHHVS